MLPMGDEARNEAEAPTFLSAVAEVARLLGIDNAASVPEDLRARRLAHAVRKPLLECVGLSEEFFAPLMTAAVYDPDTSFCRWFIEPALYAFGHRRVTAALLNYALTGTDAEQAGAKWAWYCAHLPLRADRSPAFAPGGSRDPALDEPHDVVAEWLQYTAAPKGNGSRSRGPGYGTSLTSSCTVGRETSRMAAGLGCSHLPRRRQVRGLLVGEQAGDGLGGVAHVLAAAEVAGQGPPVLQMGDAVFDSDSA